MSLSRYIASAPAGELGLHCLELSHPDWPSVIRRVSQPDNYELTLEATAPVDAGEVVTFFGWDEAEQWLGAMPTMDDGGIVTRNLQLGDVDRTLMGLIEDIRDSEIPNVCVYRLYTDIEPDAPKIRNKFEVGDCVYDEGLLSMTVRTLDMGNMRWPREQHTDANSPGWEGRW